MMIDKGPAAEAVTDEVVTGEGWEVRLLPRYTVLIHSGLGNESAGLLWPPAVYNTARTLATAEVLFKKWLVASGNDDQRATGYAQPWADVVLTSNWDGVSYGDITGGDGVVRFVLGPHGQILHEGY